MRLASDKPVNASASLPTTVAVTFTQTLSHHTEKETRKEIGPITCSKAYCVAILWSSYKLLSLPWLCKPVILCEVKARQCYCFVR